MCAATAPQAISAGGKHTCGILKSTGAALCWGNGAYGVDGHYNQRGHLNVPSVEGGFAVGPTPTHLYYIYMHLNNMVNVILARGGCAALQCKHTQHSCVAIGNSS